MSISEKLITIANNEQKVYHSGQLNIISNSKHLQGSASGTIVSVNDVTPIEHNVWFEDTSRNLFDISKIINTSNITNNQDGSLTIKANAIYSQLDSLNTLKSLCPLLKVGDVATFSMKTLSTYYKGIYLPTSKRMWQSGTALTITENDLQSRPVFYGFESSEENYGTENIISNIQVELGNATEYVPHKVNVEGVKVASKNLLLATDFYQKQQNYSQLVEDDRNCVRFTDSHPLKYEGLTFEEKTQYTVSFWYKTVTREGGGDATSRFFVFYYTNGTRSIVQQKATNGEWKYVSFTSSLDGGKSISHIGMDSVSYRNWLYVDIDTFQLEKGTTATAYTPYVADLTGVEVARYGKNWFDNEKLCLASAYKTLYNGYYYTDYIQLLPNTTYTVRGNNTAYIETGLYFVLDNGTRKNGTGVFSYPINNGYVRTITFTTTESGVISFGVSASNVELNLSKIFSNDRRFQLELGTTATEYEPYKEPITYTANADGTVEGVKSISPNMTLIPNNNAVTVSANYYKDVSKVVSDLTTAIALSGGE